MKLSRGDVDQLLEGLLGEGGRRRRGATRLDESSKWDSTTPIMYAIDTTEFSEYNLLLLQNKRQSDQLPNKVVKMNYVKKSTNSSRSPLEDLKKYVRCSQIFMNRRQIKINMFLRSVLDAFVKFLHIKSKTLLGTSEPDKKKKFVRLFWESPQEIFKKSLVRYSCRSLRSRCYTSKPP